MRHDAFKLEECVALGQMPGVQVLVRRLEKSVFPTGLAIRTLLDRSLHEVEMVALHQKDTTSERMAMFLHLYRQGETVTLIADALGLSRSYVVHHVQRRALDLVARRFLEIAERVEVSA
jgi:DNA-binding NarL/FixJ family response regulator